MKIALFSDLHGSLNDLKQFIKCVEAHNVDKIYCLGDILYHGPRNKLPESYSPIDVAKEIESIKYKTTFIKGNCDSRVDETVLDVKMFDIVEEDINDYHFIFSHGDIIDKLDYTLKNKNIICTGHTHVHYIRQHKGILFLNPGSLSIPKKDTCKSFMIIDNKNVSLYNLNNELISLFKLKNL